MMRRLKINLMDLQTAFELNNDEATAHFNSETGRVIIVTREIDMDLDGFITNGNDNAFEAVLANLRDDKTLYEWVREELIIAAEVRFSNLYKTIPKQRSRDSYSEMQDFIATLEDEHLSELLEVAIKGSGAFRRFKDVLNRYPDTRENWFKFRDECTKRRMGEWLMSEGIEPEFE